MADTDPAEDDDDLPARVAALRDDPAAAAAFVAARNELAVRWLPLVPAVLREDFPRECGGQRGDDLLQVGRLELVRSAGAFDPSRGMPFKIYAWWNVRGMMREFLRYDRIVRIPRARVPEARDVYRRERQAARHPEGPEAFPALPSPRPGPAEQAADRERVAAAEEAVARLGRRVSDRGWRVLSLRYGLGGGDPMTLAEAGAAVGVCRERARQIEAAALAALRAAAP